MRRLPDTNPYQLEIGSVVFDTRRDMPARVHDIRGSRFFLVRPGGEPWEVSWSAVRPATGRERRQLRALVIHLRTRRKGLTRA
ncbi:MULTISPECIES: hypothetical protein [Streptomyces]|uniref:Uncharacterized protein n=1 Tax=Streptomyces sudanensis TaxID=436397 RepID=A0ABY4TDP6_9ACTN|nr:MULTISPECIES: hypothetical protein [Streptomyces]URN16571.1 hypothetical protein MW084_12180 [Streptomyces sudanensis]